MCKWNTYDTCSQFHTQPWFYTPKVLSAAQKRLTFLSFMSSPGLSYSPCKEKEILNKANEITQTNAKGEGIFFFLYFFLIF